MKKTCIIFLILFSSQAKCANFGIDIWLDNPNLGGMGFEFSYGIDDSLGNNLFSESITTDSTNWDSFSRNITVSDVGKYSVWCYTSNPVGAVYLTVSGSYPTTSISSSAGGPSSFFYNQPFPIQFGNIHVIQNDFHDNILFNTISEINCDKFIIQHSNNLNEFQDLTTIKSKSNNGNSSNQLNYFYENRNFFNGNNYYRIKQIDIDGNYSFSKIVNSFRKENKKEFAIYPIPIKDKIHFQFYSDNIYDVEIQIFNLFGNKIKNYQTKFILGNNMIEISTENIFTNYYLSNIYIDGKLFSTNKILVDK